MTEKPGDNDVDPNSHPDLPVVPEIPRIAHTRAIGTVGQGSLSEAPVPKKMVRAWALWDWGSAAFNAVVTTFVFSTYLASQLFIDPAIVEAAAGNDNDPALRRALPRTRPSSPGRSPLRASHRPPRPRARSALRRVGQAQAVARHQHGPCRLAMAAMFFVEPVPAYIYLGAALLAAGNLFFEFAGVNYNAMLVQVSTPSTVGRVSGFGWGMGYVGGIVLLIVLLVLFIQNFGSESGNGILEPAVRWRRAALSTSASRSSRPPSGSRSSPFPCCAGFPRSPRANGRTASRSSAATVSSGAPCVVSSRRTRTCCSSSSRARLPRRTRRRLHLRRDHRRRRLPVQSAEVLYFAVAANVGAGIGTFIGGWLDDRLGAKNVIIGSLVGLDPRRLGGAPDRRLEDRVLDRGLFLTLFVGPVQAASRSFLARITPPGREGEIFGLYATTGRAVSFLAPGLFTLIVGSPPTRASASSASCRAARRPRAHDLR